jgi:hypothetical protein
MDGWEQRMGQFKYDQYILHRYMPPVSCGICFGVIKDQKGPSPYALCPTTGTQRPKTVFVLFHLIYRFLTVSRYRPICNSAYALVIVPVENWVGTGQRRELVNLRSYCQNMFFRLVQHSPAVVCRWIRSLSWFISIESNTGTLESESLCCLAAEEELSSKEVHRRHYIITWYLILLLSSRGSLMLLCLPLLSQRHSS